ncbi:MAG: 3-oxoacyl-ACP reductase, partial [Humibacillus sp.]
AATSLRRHVPGWPLCGGPVLVIGEGPYAAGIGQRLRSRAVDVVDSLADDWLGAVVVDLSDADDPAQLELLRRVVAPALRRLQTNSRVVLVGTDPSHTTTVAAAVTQRSLEGFTRSLAKELRAGSTANLVLAQPHSADGVWSAVEFFLSGRSAYVDGQVVRVDDSPAPDGDPLRPLAGRVAVVTGAARGIGADIARVLARDGASVVAVDVTGAGDALARVANEVRGTALQVDVTTPDAGQRIVEHARSRHGGLHVVVHNAGITRDRLLVNMDESRWDAVIDVNLRSVLRMNDAVLSPDGLGDGGRIVCVSSIAGVAGNRGQTNYGTSKAGIIGLVEALSTQVRARGITVNAVAPGFIETDMTSRIPRATREVGRRMNSLHQGGLPLDVAETIAWLSQPSAAAVTGQVVRVCGQSLLGA